MNYIRFQKNGQLAFTQSDENLIIPSTLFKFHNTDTEVKTTLSGREAYCFNGELEITEEDRICPHCGATMHLHDHYEKTLSHIPIGGNISKIHFKQNRFKCPKCQTTDSQFIPFESESHRITRELETFIMDLLALGKFSNKAIAETVGVNQHLVKEIDKKRLEKNYTLDGNSLKKPERTTRCLGIDEFKLHDGYIFATIIVDMQTGHVLWIYYGKGKQGIFDFIEHVGMEWMEHVLCLSCDMNARYFQAFEEKCDWIQPVFDHFHIIKNFNEKVISEIRKDEQRRLREEGRFQEAERLKKTRFILTSKQETLAKKDQDAKEGKIVSKGSLLFGKKDIYSKPGNLSKLEKLMQENELIFTLELIKEKLDLAYQQTDESRMADMIIDIMDICEDSGNKHLKWFENLLDKHFEGIIAHATFQITNGRLEGINNKIKTLRRQAYGYRDDEYFFLKIIDASRAKYVRNPKSHKILH